MEELRFQKELILIKQVHQNNVCFAIICILKILVIYLNQIMNVKDVDSRCIL